VSNSLAIGNFFDTAPEGAFLVDWTLDTNTPGIVKYIIVTMAGSHPGTDGSGTLVTLKFRTLQQGISNIEIVNHQLLSDASEEIPVSVGLSEITVQTGGTTPDVSGCVCPSHISEWCPSTQSCVTAGTCVSGCISNIDCNDNNACTTDGCVSSSCVNDPVQCIDDQYCDSSYGGCVCPASKPEWCPGFQSCVPQGGCTVACTNDADCNDYNACTIDSCASGICENNLVQCIDDQYCDSGYGGCICPTNKPDWCEVQQSCVAQGTCTTGCISNIECNDYNACTTDSCVSGNCVNVLLQCIDDQVCDSSYGGCVCPTDKPEWCPSTQSCVAQGTCVFSCTVNEECNDNSACTTDSCISGSCVNEPVQCIDGQYCDSSWGGCICPTDKPEWCASQNICVAQGTCVSGCTSDGDCNDYNACTTDSCVSGSCINDLILCIDDQYCDSGHGGCKCPLDKSEWCPSQQSCVAAGKGLVGGGDSAASRWEENGKRSAKNRFKVLMTSTVIPAGAAVYVQQISQSGVHPSKAVFS
jgi:hypothetical protein